MLHETDGVDDETKLWDLIENETTCMLVSRDEDGALRARPMSALVERLAREVWFFTRPSSGKHPELAVDPAVCLCFGDPDARSYVSLTGRAELSQDRERIRRSWTPFVDAWFPEGPDGPDVAMIRVAVERGEFWEVGSSHMLGALRMFTASMTDRVPDMGENGKVAF